MKRTFSIFSLAIIVSLLFSVVGLPLISARAANGWENVGPAGFSAGQVYYVSLAFNAGTPYVAFQDVQNGSKASVMKFNGTDWIYVGSAGFSAGQASFVSLAFDSGIPYVAYRDDVNGRKASVMKFDALSGNWVNVGPAGFSAGEVYNAALAIDSGTPYIAFQDRSTPGYELTVMKFDALSGNWVNVGPAGLSPSVAYFISLAIDSGIPYVAFQDRSTIGNKASVMKFDALSGNWVNVGPAGFSEDSANSISLVFDSGVPYIAYVGSSGSNVNKVSVMKFDALEGNWVNVGAAGFSDSGAAGVSLTFDSGIPYVAFSDGTAYKARVMKFDGAYWVDVGAAHFSPGMATYTSLAFDSGIPYVAYSDYANSQKVSVMKFTGGFSTTCFPLVITHTGQGLDPTASPANSTGCPAGQYAAGATINLDSAYAESEWRIASWTGTNNDSSILWTNTLTMPAAAHTVSVNYSPIEYTLTITSAHGTVTKNPDKATYQYGDVVQLTAEPSTGWSFVNWTGDVTGTSNPVSVTINGNKTVTASYSQVGYTLAITSNHGTVTKNPDKATYGYGEVVQLMAAADHDWLFVNWTGDVTGTTNPISVTMDGDKSVTANFMRRGADTTGVFRPSNGLLYLKNQNTSGFADVAINYGLGGDYPVVGDWDGNGDATIGVYRNGQFMLRNSNTLGFAEMVFPFGQIGDQPIAGDWDGDGVDTIGVYRPSNGLFLLRNSNSAGVAEMSFYLGNVGDVGIAGDWDGDGKDTTGVFRPINGIIFLKNTNETGYADVALNYGIPGDKPITGDWDNDGIDTIGVYRNGQFLLRNSNTVGFADIVFGLGNPGDMPIAGNWDGKP